MTADQRTHLRQQLDQHARQRIQAAAAYIDIPTCRACGTDHDDYTPGCPTCWNRKANRKRRLDPVFRKADAERSKRRREGA